MQWENIYSPDIRGSKYGIAYETGEFVKCVVDLNDKRIWYYINNEYHGNVFSNIKSNIFKFVVSIEIVFKFVSTMY